MNFTNKFSNPMSKIYLCFLLIVMLSINVLFLYGDLDVYKKNYSMVISRTEYYFSNVEQTARNIAEFEKELVVIESEYLKTRNIKYVQILASVLIVIVISFFMSLNVNFEVRRHFHKDEYCKDCKVKN